MDKFIFEAIGTRWQIDFNDDWPAEKQSDLRQQIEDRIEIFDQTYSRFRPDSLVTAMAKNQGTYTLPADAKPLLSLYQELYNITEGAFTPLIGQVLVDAGYDAKYRLKPKKLRPPERWAEVMDYRPPQLTLKKPVWLDFGAAGKGYLIDLVGELLKQKGLNSFCIDAGGDILQQSEKNRLLRVGLEDPRNAQRVIGLAKITNCSLCGSAGSRRQWDRFHHIIDPRRLESPKHILAVWVMAKTALIADALTTCLYFFPAESLEPHYSFEYLILYPDNSIKKSENFPAEIF